MSEHVCEWQLDEYEGGGDGSDLYRHGVYVARIDNTDIAREMLAMLNAAEQLSAEDAQEVIVFCMGSTRKAMPDLVEKLQAYAKARGNE